MKRPLPEGFVIVRSDRMPRMTFDKQCRFYLSQTLKKELGISIGSKVGLAYNPHTDAMLIDKKGRSFNVDKRSYISAKEFAVTNRLEKHDLPITYEYDEDESQGDFLVFNRIDTE